jgi:crotonobetainyl-CoA:carnitine CoA-transferase CaiB-like acyl-CoA transferase
LSDTPGSLRYPAPTLGQHTRQVLHKLGYDDAAIDLLKTAEAI